MEIIIYLEIETGTNSWTILLRRVWPRSEEPLFLWENSASQSVGVLLNVLFTLLEIYNQKLQLQTLWSASLSTPCTLKDATILSLE